MDRDQPRGQDVGPSVPLVLIGYWRSPMEPEFPDPSRFVDLSWSEEERDMVVAHLESESAIWAQAGLSYCRFCGQDNGSAEMSDGIYLWPEGLAHYLRAHHVRLPDVFVQHVRTGARADRPQLGPEGAFPQVDMDWWRAMKRP